MDQLNKIYYNPKSINRVSHNAYYSILVQLFLSTSLRKNRNFATIIIPSPTYHKQKRTPSTSLTKVRISITPSHRSAYNFGQIQSTQLAGHISCIFKNWRAGAELWSAHSDVVTSHCRLFSLAHWTFAAKIPLTSTVIQTSLAHIL